MCNADQTHRMMGDFFRTGLREFCSKAGRGIAMLCVLAVILVSTPWTGLSEDETTLSFVSVNWEPYAGEFLPEKGFTTAIIKEACSRAGFKATFHFMPWNRAVEGVRNGQFDVLYSAYYSRERAEEFGLSRPYARSPLVLCARYDSSASWNGTIESLVPYRIGIVRGYVNTPEFDSAAVLHKEETNSDLLNLRKLLGRRVDMITIDKYLAIFMLKSNPTLEDGIQNVRFLTPQMDVRSVHAMFSRKRPQWEQHLAQFDKALEEMEQDGTIEDIKLRFGFLTPDDLGEAGAVFP
ncbi:transporter substrate-binding domain-containing protein [Desulfovibrio subterraneus]|uniref:substrate-binding periplasmic protein n=1 Tax=Desulfovibrio subterraneus TaxID=2718620 RepID=UPI0022B925FF|nr:transporter substrate-binding domain-containing protein [Desulfovibrio subterraneus]WBF66492.1 transporter substrate-binding domain-containing protein [Desulfovibrio subterraneus]